MRRHLVRSLIALITCGALAVVAGCTGQPAQQAPPAEQVSANFVVSFAGANVRLTGVAAEDGLDQIRDWALIGLAAHLGLDTTALRNATYDTFPIRDAGFADLGRQASGPGRSVYDGKGVLHLLVPQGDPHESRTIGLLLDQYRTDAGTDAPGVRVHHYRIDTTATTVSIADGPTASTANVRSANGYVSKPVDTTARLTDFLTQTSDLSRLELRGGQVWASGWNWPVADGTRLDIADVSALARGYADGSSATTRPGFSLDPQTVDTAADLRAVIPGLSEDLANLIVNNDLIESERTDLTDIVDEQLFHGDLPTAELAAAGLPTDRTQLWALRSHLDGEPIYSQARYDGGLAGTAVGMTLFYTDFVAKNWAVGAGSGVPTATTVPGFVPNDHNPTPWSQCTADNTKPNQSGRLWFGADPSAVDFTANGVSLGATPTQLFFRSNGDNGAEVQPAYSFGRALTWWEQHQRDVADYEAQYQRLDDIMRWSDALDWLVNKTAERLPRLPDDQIPSDLKFADWYAQHGNLRERAPIDFVTPPAASQESIAPTPTITFTDCGGRHIEGGVSLGDIIDREGGRSYSADLPAPVRRAGLVESGSAFDDAKGSLTIMSDTLDDTGKVTDQLRHTFTTRGDTASVETVGDGRAVDEFGALKVLRSPTAVRSVGVDQTAGDGRITEHVTLDGRDVGTVAAARYGDVVTVRWKAGLMDRVRTVVQAIQQRLTATPAPGVPRAGADVLTTYQAPDGRLLYDVAGPNEPYLWITDKPPPPGNDLVLQLGEPNPDPRGDPTAAFLAAVLVPPPGRAATHWQRVVSAVDGHPASESAAAQPDPHAPTVRITTSDNKHSAVYPGSDGAVVAPTDQVFARPEGQALLRGWTDIGPAMRAARAANDGLLRGFDLGDDGVALVGADQVFIAGAGDAWADVVVRAVHEANGQIPLLRLEAGQALWTGPVPSGAPDGTRVVDAGSLSGGPGTIIYLSEVFRNNLTVHPGPVIAGALPAGTRVRVRRYTVTAATEPVTRPEILVQDGRGGEFWRWDNPPINQTRNPTPTSTTPAPPTGTPGATPAPGTTILLVCPDTGAAKGCR